MKIAFAYAGQGSQYLGMGKSFYENSEEFRNYVKYLNADEIIDICFNNEEKLNQTRYSQPCIFLISQAITHLLNESKVFCDCTFGLSLGEYNSLVCSKVLSDKQALEIVIKRGKMMQETFENKDCKMCAIVCRNIAVVEDVINKVDQGICEISNYNSLNQCVISGEHKAVEQAKKLLDGKVLKMVDLKVSGAFHSSLLDETSKEFSEYLNQYDFKKPTIKIASNYTGEFETDNFKELMVNQLNHSVQLVSDIKTILNESVDLIIEIGPKKVVSGFIKQIDRNVKVMNIDTYQDYLNVLEVINNE